MKKTISILFIIVSFVFIFTACGKKIARNQGDLLPDESIVRTDESDREQENEQNKTEETVDGNNVQSGGNGYRVETTTGLYNDFSTQFNSYSSDRSGREYLEEFNGAQGVYKISANTSEVNALLGASAIKSYMQDGKAYFEAHDKMVFRVYTDESGDFKILNNYTDSDSTGEVVIGTGNGEWSDSIGTSSGLNPLLGFTVKADALAVTDAWTDYEVPMADFMSIWDRLQNKTSYVYFDKARTIYFDGIYAVKTLDVVSDVADIMLNREFEISDNIDEIISTKSLYGLKLTILLNNKEIFPTDNKITVTEKGHLEFIYTATDENGLLYRGRYAYVID